MNTTNEKSRLHYLDLLKTIAIFCVILYHSLTVSGNVRSGSLVSYFNYFIISCLSICMPVFFAVNGGLLFNKSFHLKKHIRKMAHMIFLVIVWDMGNVLVKATFLYHTADPASILRHFWSFDAGWSNQLWFLMALFVLYFFFPILKATYDTKKHTFLIFTAASLVIVCGNNMLLICTRLVAFLFHAPVPTSDINFFNQFNPFRDIYGFSFAYFLVGALLVTHIRHLSRKLSFMLALILYLASMLCLTLYGVMCSYGQDTYFDPVWGGMETIFVLIGTLCIFRCSLAYRYSEKRICRYVRFISDHSLGIYLLQSILADFMHTALSHTPISGNILINIGAALVLLWICALLSSVASKIPVLSKIFTL